MTPFHRNQSTAVGINLMTRTAATFDQMAGNHSLPSAASTGRRLWREIQAGNCSLPPDRNEIALRTTKLLGAQCNFKAPKIKQCGLLIPDSAETLSFMLLGAISRPRTEQCSP